MCLIFALKCSLDFVGYKQNDQEVNPISCCYTRSVPKVLSSTFLITWNQEESTYFIFILNFMMNTFILQRSISSHDNTQQPIIWLLHMTGNHYNTFCTWLIDFPWYTPFQIKKFNDISDSVFHQSLDSGLAQ